MHFVLSIILGFWSILINFQLLASFLQHNFSHLESEWEKKIGENYFIQKPIKNKDLIRRITGIINKN